jgi:hypothetical protein
MHRIGATGKWLALFAGDPSHAALIATQVNDATREPENRAAMTEEGTVAMMGFCTVAFRNLLKAQIEGLILSPYGMKRDQFLNHGRAVFGDDKFLRIVDQIERAGLGTEFMVGGFDSGGPHLFSVNDPGNTRIHDAECFHAIGCGAPLADAALTRSFDPFHSVNEIIYWLLDAKFRAEAAPGVGRKTHVVVLSANGETQTIRDDKIQAIKAAWEAHNKIVVPADAGEIIQKTLSEIPVEKFNLAVDNPKTEG